MLSGLTKFTWERKDFRLSSLLVCVRISWSDFGPNEQQESRATNRHTSLCQQAYLVFTPIFQLVFVSKLVYYDSNNKFWVSPQKYILYNSLWFSDFLPKPRVLIEIIQSKFWVTIGTWWGWKIKYYLRKVNSSRSKIYVSWWLIIMNLPNILHLKTR